jgi:hypothetical protein
VLISPTQTGVDLMQAAAGRRVDVIVAALAALPTGDRRAIVAAAPSLRELSARVPAVARDLARRDAPDPPAG